MTDTQTAPKLATVGQHAKMLDIKPHQIHYMIRLGLISPVALLCVGAAEWPLYDVETVEEVASARLETNH
jgi:hypothetical protein